MLCTGRIEVDEEVDEPSAQNIDDEIELALQDRWRFRNIGWGAISSICRYLDTDESLERQSSVMALMNGITHVAHYDSPAPVDLPVDNICRCLQKQVDAYDDRDLERTRRRILMDGALVLGHINDPNAIDTLLMLINTGKDHDLDGGYSRVDEYSLKAVLSIVKSSSSFSKGEDGYPPQSKIVLLEGQAENIEEQVMGFLDISDDPHDRITALNILVMLEQPHIIEYMVDVMESDSYRERGVALVAFRENWDPRLMPLILSQLGLRDDSEFGDLNPNWYLSDIVEIIGLRGGAEQVQLLIDLLEEYSKMSVRGAMNVRNTVRESLVDLAEHSRDSVEQSMEQEGISPGFRRSLAKVLKLIDEAEEDIRAPVQMRYDLFSWRTEKFNDEGLEYPFQILTDRQIFEIFRRAPQTYEALMDIDGVGAYKVNKYGRELLSIIRRHMNPNDPAAAIVRPWNIPLDVRRWLYTVLESVDSGLWNGLSDEEKQDYLKRSDAHTKMRIKKEAGLDHILGGNDHEILGKVIDMVIRSLTFESMLAVAGQKRGVRYSRFLQCFECGASGVEFGDGHPCKCHICHSALQGTQCVNVICMLNVTKTMI